jgi:hypothetical protein
VTYKIFRVSAGHVVGARDIEADSAEEAIGLAQRMVGEEPSELWLGERLIKTFNVSTGGRS